MKPYIRILACGLALLAPIGSFVQAADNVMASRGRVLVLDNERTIEGDIQRDGDDYRIRRPVGEVWVPGAKVLRLCASWQDAYAFLRGRANLGDSDERMRLARWCQLHNLKVEALAEVNAAVVLRPYNEEARRLQTLLQRSATAPTPAATAKAVEAERALPIASVDLSVEAMSTFVTRVQPILMNACVRCHVGEQGGSFKLTRCYQGGAPSQRATRINLAAVVSAIDKKRPELSPLLIKSVSVHGRGGPAPLKGRQSPAYRNLQEWVESTLATNPQLAEAGSEPAAPRKDPKQTPPAADATPTEIGTFSGAIPAVFRVPDGVPVVGLSPAVVAAKTTKPAQPAAPAEVSVAAAVVRPSSRPETSAAPRPVDEFDPVIFNQQAEPAK